MKFDRRLLDLFGTDLPIVQAPMAGVQDDVLAIAVAKAGGLGSLPAAMTTAELLTTQVTRFRAACGDKKLNLNFFAHTPPVPDKVREDVWRATLNPYYVELGIDPNGPAPSSNRAPFDDAFCQVVEALKPGVVSFHFGLPDETLLARVRAAGCAIIASATTVAEARYLAGKGCDAVIAQGAEAGGHRGMFLTDKVAEQIGSFALVPQVVDSVDIPVIAAGAIGDARGIAAAFALGAAGVQIGSAYMHTPEAKLAAPHRARLQAARENPAGVTTAITNLITGRPARGFINRLMREQGPLSDAAPAFPLAGSALAPLAAKSQATGDFSSQWAGQAVGLGRALPAGELTQALWAEAEALLRRMAG
jgi:nitronate monooxygenase